MQPCKLTRSIATAASPKVGYDLATVLGLISAAIPVLDGLIKFCKKNPAPADYRDAAQNAKRRNGTYRPKVLKDTKSAIAAKAVHQNIRLDDEQLTTLAVHVLDGVASGSNEDIQEAMDLLQAGS